jgi:hypothetical protein
VAAPAERPDPRLCPLCGAANRCAMELERSSGLKQPPCWCTQVEFKREVLERIPAPARGLACICGACAAGQ